VTTRFFFAIFAAFLRGLRGKELKRHHRNEERNGIAVKCLWVSTRMYYFKVLPARAN
jgi:hypothetical protein